MITRPWTFALKRSVHRLLAVAGLELERSSITGKFSLHRIDRIGRHHIRDVKQILGSNIRCVFDVGANTGQTAQQFLRSFPTATIFSFEPDVEAHAELESRVPASRRFRSFRLGLGNVVGNASLLVNRSSLTNSFLRVAPGAGAFFTEPEMLLPSGNQCVPMTTLDAFCSDNQVDHIDLLKMDVQGYELEILAGATHLLVRGAIALIYLEVSFVQIYEGQPLFPDVYQYLFERGYRFVGLYESGHRTRFYHVSGNALFVREELGRRG